MADIPRILISFFPFILPPSPEGGRRRKEEEGGRKRRRKKEEGEGRRMKEEEPLTQSSANTLVYTRDWRQSLAPLSEEIASSVHFQNRISQIGTHSDALFVDLKLNTADDVPFLGHKVLPLSFPPFYFLLPLFCPSLSSPPLPSSLPLLPSYLLHPLPSFLPSPSPSLPGKPPKIFVAANSKFFSL
jgi:hypothetical protein